MPIEPDSPDYFRGKLDEWQEWSAANWPRNADWCARHWSPCPVEGYNGMAATVVLLRESLNLLPAHVRRAGASAWEPWRLSQDRPTCCRMGEDKMAEIWAQCGPETGPDSPVT